MWKTYKLCNWLHALLCVIVYTVQCTYFLLKMYVQFTRIYTYLHTLKSTYTVGIPYTYTAYPHKYETFNTQKQLIFTYFVFIIVWLLLLRFFNSFSLFFKWKRMINKPNGEEARTNINCLVTKLIVINNHIHHRHWDDVKYFRWKNYVHTTTGIILNKKISAVLDFSKNNNNFEMKIGSNVGKFLCFCS